MSASATDYLKIEDELVILFARLHADLPPGIASLAVRRTDAHGAHVTVFPRNPRAASVWAHAENGVPLIDFGFGEYEPTWELPLEGENPEAGREELFLELEQLCRAVMAGHCENRRRFLSLGSVVRVGPRDYKVCHSLIFWPKPRFRGTRRYESYVPDRLMPETIDAI
jgi:hypothetical protein